MDLNDPSLDAVRDLLPPLDLRTIEDLAADEWDTEESFREALTGLPARPNVTR